MPGFNNPIQNCTACHGANLQGGADGQPSCTRCHGVKW
jgi:mono/diheme cytochrome c family protein